jgi:hypothetical protein
MQCTIGGCALRVESRIDGRNGAFGAYVARPKTVPAPAVVAPDLFWHQEPGVDLDPSRGAGALDSLQVYEPARAAAARMMVVRVSAKCAATSDRQNILGAIQHYTTHDGTGPDGYVSHHARRGARW